MSCRSCSRRVVPSRVAVGELCVRVCVWVWGGVHRSPHPSLQQVAGQGTTLSRPLSFVRWAPRPPHSWPLL